MASEHPVFGNARLRTIVCPKCVSGDMVYGEILEVQPPEIAAHSSWCSKVKCPKCDYKWYVCRQCSNHREILDTNKRLKNHRQKYHSRKKNQQANPSLPITGTTGPVQEDNHSDPIKPHNNHSKQAKSVGKRKRKEQDVTSSKGSATLASNIDTDSDVTFHNHVENDDTPSLELGGIPTAVADCQFEREESTQFFGNNYHSKDGIAYLISRSFYLNQIDPKKIPKEDLDMCLKLSLLVKTLTRDQSEQLGDFLELLLKRVDEMDTLAKQYRDYLSHIISQKKNALPATVTTAGQIMSRKQWISQSRSSHYAYRQSPRMRPR